MIESHASKTSDELVRYFFSGKYEKQEYVEFLKSLVAFIANSPHPTPLSQGRGDELQVMLDELHEDMNGIMRHNLQGRYVVDKWIMRLGA